jgi:hypothetical protein
MFMRSGTKPAETTAASAAPAQVVDDRTNSASTGSASTSDDPDVAKAKAIVKEQFFPDQVDNSGSAKYQREWYMIKGAVQQAGYPCAAVAYVQQTMEGAFKAVCKVALHTNKYDAFTIDPNAETVVPYR